MPIEILHLRAALRAPTMMDERRVLTASPASS
jgi:hypothetical protein